MATRIGSAFFDVTFNTAAARREVTALVSTANRQFGLIGGLGAVGATVVIGGLLNATKDIGDAALEASVDYEQAFAGVRKTLDTGTLSAEEAEQVFGRLNDQFRQLATRTPLDLNTEITRVGELGGQLGIAAEDLIGFTEVISEVGVTTNVAVDDAAIAFARLANIMNIPQSEFRDVGDSLINLGNNLAAQEDEILRFGLRIAAVGNIVGFTQDEVLAMAGAFSAVGVPAERGGTAVQRVLIGIEQAVVSASDKLDVFAETSGLTAEEFSNLWRTDASEAFTQFIEGLGRAGPSAFRILEDLELGTVRVRGTLLSLAEAGPRLREAFEIGANASGALARESDIFFNTTQANVKELGNVINDAGITVGNQLSGPFNEIVTFIREWIQENPELIDQLGTGLAGVLESVAGLIEDNIDIVEDFIAILPQLADEAIETAGPFIEFIRFLADTGAAIAEFRREVQEGAGEGGLFNLDQLADTTLFTNLFELGDRLLGNVESSFDRLAFSSRTFNAETAEGFEKFLAIVPPFSILNELATGLGKAIGNAQEGALSLARDTLLQDLGAGVDPVEALTNAFIELDDNLQQVGGNVSQYGFDALTEGIRLTDEQVVQLIRDLATAGVELPLELRQIAGLVRSSARRPVGGRGGRRGRGGNLEGAALLEEARLAQEAADAELYANTLKGVGEAAAEAGVSISTLLANAGRLAPELQAGIDQFGAGVIAGDLFTQSLQNLRNAIDFGGAQIFEFDLLTDLEEAEVHGKDIIKNLTEQANEFAEFEANLAILAAQGFDDLARELAEAGPEARHAAEDFVTGFADPQVAEDIIEHGGTLGEETLARLQEALAEGDISPELLNLASQFSSTEVQELVYEAGDLIGQVYGTGILQAVAAALAQLPGLFGGVTIPGGFVPSTGNAGRDDFEKSSATTVVTQNFQNVPNPTSVTVQTAQGIAAVVD